MAEWKVNMEYDDGLGSVEFHKGTINEVLKKLAEDNFSGLTEMGIELMEEGK